MAFKNSQTFIIPLFSLSFYYLQYDTKVRLCEYIGCSSSPMRISLGDWSNSIRKEEVDKQNIINPLKHMRRCTHKISIFDSIP